MSLLNYIVGVQLKKHTIEEIRHLVGLEPTLEISYRDLVLWMFHDIQAQKIAVGR
jgi:hypothetical protein